MMIQVSWAGIGVMIAVLLHAAASIWWASKITQSIDTIGKTLLRLDKEFEKRDDQLKIQWKKIDTMDSRLVKVETTMDINK